MRRGLRTRLLGLSGKLLVGLILAFIVLPAFVGQPWPPSTTGRS